MAQGACADAVLQGVTQVQIDVTDETHGWAKAIPGNCECLTSSTCCGSSAQIIWREGGLGKQEAVVRLSNCQCCETVNTECPCLDDVIPGAVTIEINPTATVCSCNGTLSLDGAGPCDMSGSTPIFPNTINIGGIPIPNACILGDRFFQTCEINHILATDPPSGTVTLPCPFPPTPDIGRTRTRAYSCGGSFIREWINGTYSGRVFHDEATDSLCIELTATIKIHWALGYTDNRIVWYSRPWQFVLVSQSGTNCTWQRQWTGPETVDPLSPNQEGPCPGIPTVGGFATEAFLNQAETERVCVYRAKIPRDQCGTLPGPYTLQLVSDSQPNVVDLTVPDPSLPTPTINCQRPPGGLIPNSVVPQRVISGSVGPLTHCKPQNPTAEFPSE
jgi:hypothetical protein